MDPLRQVATPLPAHCGLAALVDVETTGLSPVRDEVVELALLLFAFDRRTGEVAGVVDEYVGLRQPSRPIPPAATAVHGIADDAVRGRVLDDRRVRALLDRAEFLVAHHAAFDRAFVTRLYPEAARKPWLCTVEGIDWRRHGFRSRRLQALLAAHGIRDAGAHRAGADCRAVLALLAHRLPDGTTYLRHLLERYGLRVAREG